MSRTPKKQVVKKQAAASTKRTPIDQADLDAWVESQRHRTSGCLMCSNPAANETLKSLLLSMARNRAYRIPIQAIREMLLTKHPKAEIGQRGLERHLRMCERKLYDKARGRGN